MTEPIHHDLVVSPDDTLGRVDRFLVGALAKRGVFASRATIQKWIAAARVTLGGRPARADETVRIGAHVQVWPLLAEPTSAVPDASVTFGVLFEDQYLLVVDKPAGLVVHPARGHAGGTLVHGLLARGSFDRRRLGGADDPAFDRPGIVHRLDKGTSGVMVVAKDERTREGLKALFAAHAIERAYLAIVVGDAIDGRYDTFHGRDPKNRLKFTSLGRAGRRAITNVKVIERLPGARAALVECRLETGRTHQIRVHLTECAKTPILGDPLYGRAPRDPEIRAVANRLGRQALHAAVLGFLHPATGEQLRFEQEPPEDFKSALRDLRSLSARRRA
jgi:23S rRNA pseudouridine1911/1915/1917 synthase